ncbi:hypothetical protein [Flavobacterium sp. NKUCC04_CG]|uniref:hypothetical protein n=1 Tax=Flavobacterium sp. NKUCC04_CG TaxID=2842121 RepID=UPI001C5B9DEE|nr:hypothetical protein [Flavobacterium sp. NKUCC04_CG]MBW3520423.1 hypothetical protein [Flavobacterium sp. NKUCC04_CG]
MVLLVECGINDPHNYKNGLVNADLTNVVWKISSAGIFTDILDSNREFQIGKGIDKGQLKIFRNISDLESVTVTFTAKYLEPISKRIVNFQESFVLITNPIATAPTLLDTSAPYGYNLYPTINNQGLVCQADLFRGPEKLAAAYYWSKNNVEITDSNGYLNSKTDKLFVLSSAITKQGDVIKVEVADCSAHLNQLQDDWVEAQPEVVDWRGLYENNPENLQNNSLFQDGSFTDWVGSYGIQKVNGIVYEKEITIVAAAARLEKSINGLKIGEQYTISFFLKNEFDVIFKGHGGATALEKRTVLTSEFNFVNYTFKAAATRVILRWYVGSPAAALNKKCYLHHVKVQEGEIASTWSPSKLDLQTLISQKKIEAKTTVKLPLNYRPTVKPTALFKGDYLLMKKYPIYEPQLIGPNTINPDLAEIEYEIVLNTSDGILQNAEAHFSVGWLKQTNGAFLYKGFKVKIPISKLLELNSLNKELDFEVFEDLTQKP